MVMAGRVSVVLATLILVWATGLADGAYQNRIYTKTESDVETVYEKWNNIENSVLELLRNGVKSILPTLVRMSSQLDTTPECTSAILRTISALKDGKLWAFKMFDSMGKPMGGQLSGTFSFFGSYDQCLNITVPNSWKPEKEDFRGKYCLARLQFPMPPRPENNYVIDDTLNSMKNLTVKSELFGDLKRLSSVFYSFTYQLGLCVPSVCTNDDISQIIEATAANLEMNGDVKSCETSLDETVVDANQIAVFVVIGIFLTITLTATFYEELGKIFRNHMSYDKTNIWWKLVRALSMRLNTKKLFNTDIGPADKTFSCLNGLRLISICWIVAVHVYSLYSPNLYREGLNVNGFPKKLFFQVITSASLSVNTFFFITGVLMTHQIVTLVDTKGLRFFNVPLIVVRRIWKLMPSAMMTLGLIVILPLMNNGPNWTEEIYALVSPTRKNWWAVLFSVSNFLRTDEMPMISIWYNSADIQLFMLGLIILAILFRRPTVAYALMGILSVAAVIITGVITYLSKSLPVFILRSPDKDFLFEQVLFTHTLPHVHVSTFIIGMAIGVFFARCKKPKVPLWGVLVGWPLSLGLLFASLFSGYAYTYGPLPSPGESFIFSVFFRTVWALGLAILTFLCATNNGGYINSFLSWRGFTPLNRLSYLVYLLHILVITFYYGSLRGVLDCFHHQAVWIVSGTVTLSFVAAYVMKIVFEAPLAELEKILLEKIFTKMFTTDTQSNNGEVTKPITILTIKNTTKL